MHREEAQMRGSMAYIQLIVGYGAFTDTYGLQAFRIEGSAMRRCHTRTVSISVEFAIRHIQSKLCANCQITVEMSHTQASLQLPLHGCTRQRLGLSLARQARGDLPPQTTPKQRSQSQHTACTPTNQIRYSHHFTPLNFRVYTRKQSSLFDPSARQLLSSARRATAKLSTNTMQSEHRKIELQSPSDLAYLTSQIRTAARQKLDLHLPAQPSDSADDLRAQTEVLVDAFVAQVLAGLRNNITINGLDVVAQSRGGGFGDGDEMEGVVAERVQGVEEEEFEAFDEKLRVKLAKEVDKRDKLVASISKHRRETANKSARAFEERFEAEQRAAEEQRRVRLERAQTVVEEDALDIKIARDEEVRNNWERAIEGLGRLNKGLPETRARLERCGDVVGYLGGEKE